MSKKEKPFFDVFLGGKARFLPLTNQEMDPRMEVFFLLGLLLGELLLLLERFLFYSTSQSAKNCSFSSFVISFSLPRTFKTALAQIFREEQ